MEDAVEIQCGYCGEWWSISVDPTGGAEQVMIEDCAVCCRPNRVVVSVDEESGEVQVSSGYEG